MCNPVADGLKSGNRLDRRLVGVVGYVQRRTGVQVSGDRNGLVVIAGGLRIGIGKKRYDSRFDVQHPRFALNILNPPTS